MDNRELAAGPAEDTDVYFDDWERPAIGLARGPPLFRAGRPPLSLHASIRPRLKKAVAFLSLAPSVRASCFSLLAAVRLFKYRARSSRKTPSSPLCYLPDLHDCEKGGTGGDYALVRYYFVSFVVTVGAASRRFKLQCARPRISIRPAAVPPRAFLGRRRGGLRFLATDFADRPGFRASAQDNETKLPVTGEPSFSARVARVAAPPLRVRPPPLL